MTAGLVTGKLLLTDSTHILANAAKEKREVIEVPDTPSEYVKKLDREALEGCHGIIPLRKSLPESCFSTLGTTGELIVITKGENGYSPTDVFPQNTSPKEGAAALNAANGVTKAQEAAMVAGSMFGWETPAANPKNYDALGQPIKNQRRSHAAER